METTITQLGHKFDWLSGRMDALSQRFDELLTFLQEHAATKEDLQAYATKEDLKAFATKEDLHRELAVFKMDLIDRTDAKLLEVKNDLIRQFAPSSI